MWVGVRARVKVRGRVRIRAASLCLSLSLYLYLYCLLLASRLDSSNASSIFTLYRDYNDNDLIVTDHPLLPRLHQELGQCAENVKNNTNTNTNTNTNSNSISNTNSNSNSNTTESPCSNLISLLDLCNRIGNDYVQLLLYDRAQEIFKV